MKLRMAENSLFAILLRSAWWVSAAIAAGIVALVAAVVPREYFVFGAFAALPFAVIAVIAAARQLRTPSAVRVDRTLETLRAMAWPEFSQTIEAGLRAQGYGVEALGLAAADFEAIKDGRRTLVSAKRWKVARTGVNPLRELAAAVQARDANGGMYIAAGEVTEQARAFAAKNGIRLVDGTALVQWLPSARSRGRALAATTPR
jgi:restriction system protein